MIDYEEKFEEVGESLYHSKIGGYSLEFIDYLKSQLKEKDIEIESQLTKIYALNARVSHRGFENLNITRLARKSSETIEQLREEIAELKFKNERTTKERDNHFRDIIKLENELSELKDENKRLASSNLKLDMENQSLGRSLTAKDKEIEELKKLRSSDSALIDKLEHGDCELLRKHNRCPLSSEIAELKSEHERLLKRDGNAKIFLAFNDDIDPFHQERLQVVDVGVSDNVYIVESKLFNKVQSDMAALKAKTREV